MARANPHERWIVALFLPNAGIVCVMIEGRKRRDRDTSIKRRQVQTGTFIEVLAINTLLSYNLVQIYIMLYHADGYSHSSSSTPSHDLEISFL